MRALLPLLAAAALFAAGCVSPPASTPEGAERPIDPAAWDAVRALVGDAPCETDVGADTSANLVTLGHYQTDEGDIGEIDVRGDRAIFSRHQMGGLYVADLRDPRNISIVGTLVQEGATAFDLKWLPEKEAAVIGGGEGKLYVVDLTDPANPVVVSEADVSTQAHMVQPALLGGVTYVYVASQSSNAPAFVYKMEGWNLSLVGSFGLPAGPIGSGPLGNHDIAIVNDTLLQKTTLYLADGVAGWSAWSLDDPAAPQRIGGSVGQELGAGYVHTVRVGFFEGKRIVVTMQEVGQNSLKVYDATDLSKPVLLARWNADPSKPTAPQHNIQLLGPWLFMGHYTNGFYVFNLTSVISGPPVVGTLSLAPVGHWAVEEPAEADALGFANVWDVAVRRGVVYASDLTGRVTAVAFACLPIGDEAATATL
ncbi:MAG TPA: hypothetical protein VM370_04210 [Candidatus Thermoplasmatota archaeon]|nr:hypothetical protein [Candidatus Thermoplasmatota archaeon]